jgi:parallel beta-helix repeat protein
MFLNPSYGNYVLQALSPCIDMGDPNYPLDPDGTRTDIGAIYFDQSGPPQPDIVVNPVSLDFGQAPIGRPSVLTLTILNGGNLGLEVIDIGSDNSAFTASEASFSVETGTNHTIAVIFSPRKQIEYEGLISIRSNDNDEPLVQVSLIGIGSRLPSGDVIRVPKDYSTIQEGLNAAESWDTVLISDGTYYENIIWPHTDKVTLRSANGSVTTVIDGSNAEESVIYVGNGQKGVLIEGFTIKNGIGSIPTFHGSIRFGGGILIDECVTATIQECQIVGNGDPDKAEYSGGIFISRASNVTIDRCEIVNNLGPGIYYRNSTVEGELKNCLVAGNAGNGIYAQSSPVRIYNNTICSNGWSGIYLYTPWPYIFNNLIVSNSIGIGSDNPYISDLITFNNVWNNSTNYADTVGNILGQNGNVSIDPVFVGGEPFDYHLTPVSPCIDAGDPNYVSEPNETDLDGKPRIVGGRIDMGAYEYRLPIQADMMLIPRSISLKSKGQWIAAFIRLPEEYNVADIDPNSILLENEIKPDSFRLIEDEQTAIARFDREQVQSILDIGEVELTITGQLTDGNLFEARDIIKVIDKGVGKSGK